MDEWEAWDSALGSDPRPHPPGLAEHEGPVPITGPSFPIPSRRVGNHHTGLGRLCSLPDGAGPGARGEISRMTGNRVSAGREGGRLGRACPALILRCVGRSRTDDLGLSEEEVVVVRWIQRKLKMAM